MYDSGLPVPDLTNAVSYASAQHHGQLPLETILRDTAIIYALAWLWRRLTRPSSRRPAQPSGASTGLCRCGRH
jgi:hypothetical protein